MLYPVYSRVCLFLNSLPLRSFVFVTTSLMPGALKLIKNCYYIVYFRCNCVSNVCSVLSEVLPHITASREKSRSRNRVEQLDNRNRNQEWNGTTKSGEEKRKLNPTLT